MKTTVSYLLGAAIALLSIAAHADNHVAYTVTHKGDLLWDAAVVAPVGQAGDFQIMWSGEGERSDSFEPMRMMLSAFPKDGRTYLIKAVFLMMKGKTWTIIAEPSVLTAANEKATIGISTGPVKMNRSDREPYVPDWLFTFEIEENWVDPEGAAEFSVASDPLASEILLSGDCHYTLANCTIWCGNVPPTMCWAGPPCITTLHCPPVF